MSCPTPHKQVFLSRREATTWTRRRDFDGPRYVYRCPGGEHWHLSSMPKRLARKIRKERKRETTT